MVGFDSENNRVGELVLDSRHAVFEDGNVEVDQKAFFEAGQKQIGEQLGLVCRFRVVT